MAKHVEVDSITSSTNRSAKNFWALVDMAEDAEVGEGVGGNNKMVRKITSLQKFK